MLKLMVVDDSNIIRSKISRAYDAQQFELVAIASNGQEAVEKFADCRPDIVTMDLTMPHMDGIECIEKLVAIDPTVAILVISALSDEATGLEAIQKGADGFLLKPFTEQQLGDALATMIEDSVI